MRVSDFLLSVRSDLQEKTQQWTDSELLTKLQRSYISLQFDLPYFIAKSELVIKEGTTEYYIDAKALQNMSLVIDGILFSYSEMDHIYIKPNEYLYAFNENRVIINQTPKADTIGTLICKYEKQLQSMNCEIEIPRNWHKALRYLLMSEIHEKPTRNTKERNLSAYYINLYDKEIAKLKKPKARPRNITSNYQRI